MSYLVPGAACFLRSALSALITALRMLALTARTSTLLNDIECNGRIGQQLSYL